MEVEYKILSHADILKKTNKNNYDGSCSDGSIKSDSEHDQDDLSLPDKRIFVWEIKRQALEPLPTPPFQLPEQKMEEDQAQSSTLDDDENREQNEQKHWYIECLAREMGYAV